jgi:nucleoside-diphosphate-sugar epimerase
MTPARSFWAGKRVFLTGHSGFKGAWLALWLHRLGAQVMGFSLPPETSPSLSEQAAIASVIATATGDIRDAPALSAAIRAFTPDIVLHLAAQSLVQRSYREPALTFETNVIGTVNVLEAVRQTDSVRAVVIVTTESATRTANGSGPTAKPTRLVAMIPTVPARPAPRSPSPPGADPIFRPPPAAGLPLPPRAPVMSSAVVTGRRIA